MEGENGIEYTPFSWKTGDVSGRTKFGECILVPCDMSAILIRHSALRRLRGPTNVCPVTLAGDGKEQGWSNGPGLDKNLAARK